MRATSCCSLGVKSGAGVAPAPREVQSRRGGPAAFPAALQIFSALALALGLAAAALAKDYETVEFAAPHLGGTKVSFNVILPSDYAASGRRYSVLYLLHGFTDHFPAWVTYTRISEYARPFEEIIVMPEGDNGWYTNNYADPKLAWEDYLVLDLIPYVDAHYRTLASRPGRAVAGLSMGGYGAMKLGLKYPQLFSAVASLSGALRSAQGEWFKTAKDERIRKVIEADFGPPENPARVENDPFELVRKVPKDQLPQIYFSVGADDFLLEDNRAFARRLAELKVPYQYREFPGKHEWTVWDREIQVVLSLQAAVIGAGISRPKP